MKHQQIMLMALLLSMGGYTVASSVLHTKPAAKAVNKEQKNAKKLSENEQKMPLLEHHLKKKTPESEHKIDPSKPATTAA